MTIDWEVVLGFVDHRSELLLELIDIFFSENADIVPRIAKAIDEGNTGELRLYAHRLKGCLRYFGDTEAAQLAAELELNGRTGTLDGAPQLLDQLRTAVEDLLPEMHAYKQAHQKS